MDTNPNGVNGTSNWSIDDSGTLHIGEGELAPSDKANNSGYSPWYAYSANIKTVTFDGQVIANTDSNALFSGLRNVTEFHNMENFNTSNVTDMSQMFAGTSKLSNLNLSNFDTSNVTDMSDMFRGCNAETIDLSGFNTSNVLNMSGMFYSCVIESIDLTHFDTAKVTDMSDMFNNIKFMETIDLSSFDTSNVTDMTRMLIGMWSLQSLDLSNFKTPNLINAASMFYNDLELSYLNISQFSVSGTVSQMFGNCDKLSTLVLGDHLSSDITSVQLSAIEKEYPYTGSWSRKENKQVIGSSQDLMANYSEAGTYIWQKDLSSVEVKDSSIKLNSKWTPESNFVSGTDGEGNPLAFSAVVTTGDVDTKSPGDYTVKYEYISKFGYSISKDAAIEVLEAQNLQSINGENYTMTMGSATPTVSDFKGSATDTDGNAIDVTADFSKVNFSKPGNYDVTLNSSDGQSKIFMLTIVKKDDTQLVPVLRAYNSNDGDHLYTTSQKEYDWITGLKWHAEGVAFQSVLSDYESALPVYRLYNPNSGEHFYTISDKEYNWVAANGWRKEQIGFYIVPKDQGESVFRVFNPNTTGPGSHLFTSSKKEADWLIRLGWRDEGIAFYSPK